MYICTLFLFLRSMYYTKEIANIPKMKLLLYYILEILLGGIMFNKFFGGNDCGCDDMKTCGAGDCTWIIILILILCNCGCKIDPCLLIIILLLLCGCGCGGNKSGCC